MPPQQPRIATHDHGRAVERALLVARAFLSRERQKIDLLVGLELANRIEPARQQDFVDQLIELGDVLRQLDLALRIDLLLRQLQPQADARERGAQLMRGIGQQQLVRADQLLDARRGLVEACGEPRDLVAALDLDARLEIAGAEQFDTRLQALQPARDAARDRKGGERDGERDRAKKCHQREARTLIAAAARAPRASVRREAGPTRPGRRRRRAIHRCRGIGSGRARGARSRPGVARSR